MQELTAVAPDATASQTSTLAIEPASVALPSKSPPIRVSAKRLTRCSSDKLGPCLAVSIVAVLLLSLTIALVGAIGGGDHGVVHRDTEVLLHAGEEEVAGVGDGLAAVGVDPDELGGVATGRARLRARGAVGCVPAGVQTTWPRRTALRRRAPPPRPRLHALAAP